MVQANGGEPLNRTADHSGWDRLPAWSPDGEQIAFASEREGGAVFVMPVLAGPARFVAPLEGTALTHQSAPMWSSDSKTLALFGSEGPFPRGNFISIVTLDGGETKRVPIPQYGIDFSWSPDGEYFAWMPTNHSYEVSEIWTIRVRDGESFLLLDGPWVHQRPTWMDSKSLYFVSDRGGEMDLWSQALDGTGRAAGAPQAITANLGIRHALLSPDGTRLAYSKRHEIANVWRVPILEERVATWSDAQQITFDESWAPDGQIVFTALNRTGLEQISADGGESEILTVPDRERREKGHRWAEVLPGGRAVLFTLCDNDITQFDDASIAVLSLETGDYKVLVEGGMHARYSATGHVVYARDGSLMAVPFDMDTLEVTGAPTLVLEGLMTASTTGSAQFALSQDGTLLYAPGRSWENDRRVIEVDREGRARPLMESHRAFYEVDLAPDSRSLAVAIDGANMSLWLYDLSRNTLTRLVTGFENFSPVWAPTGDRVAFHSSRTGSASNLYWIAGGGGAPDRLTTSEYSQWPRSWSTDGRTIAFDELRPETGYDIMLLSMEGGGAPQPFLQTESNERCLAFAPSGDWVAYVSDESGTDEIYLQPFPGPGRRWQVSTNGGTKPQWSPDGGEIFYRDGDRMMAVRAETEGGLRLGSPAVLFERASIDGAYDVIPDGRGFVMIDESETPPLPTQLILVQNWAEELKRLAPIN